MEKSHLVGILINCKLGSGLRDRRMRDVTTEFDTPAVRETLTKYKADDTHPVAFPTSETYVGR